MRREDHGPLAPKVADQLADLDALIGVEPLGRLVEDEQIGTMQNRGRETNPLAEPLGQLADRAIEDRLDRRRTDRVVNRGATFRASEVSEARDKVEILRHEHFAVQRIVFREKPDPPLGGTTGVCQRHTIDSDVPAVRLEYCVIMRMVVDFPAPFGPRSRRPVRGRS